MLWLIKKSAYVIYEWPLSALLKLLLQFGVNPEDYDALAEQILEGVATSRKRMRRAGHSGRKSSGYTASSSRNSIIVPRLV